jgi:hypothetical protein
LNFLPAGRQVASFLSREKMGRNPYLILRQRRINLQLDPVPKLIREITKEVELMP